MKGTMKDLMFVVLKLLLFAPIAHGAFCDTPLFAPWRRTTRILIEGKGWSRPALIYVDGEMVVSDDKTTSTLMSEDNSISQKQQSSTAAFLDFLNAPDQRGPLAVLAAAQTNMDLASIVHMQVNSVTEQQIQMEVISACGDDTGSCVNVLVTMDFPNAPCRTEADIVNNLGRLYQQASAILDKKRQEEEGEIEEVVVADEQLHAVENIQVEVEDDENDTTDESLSSEEVDKLEQFENEDSQWIDHHNDNLTDSTSWWLPPPTSDLIDEYNTVMTAINNDVFLNDLRELFVRYYNKLDNDVQLTLNDVDQISVIALGQRGLILEQGISSSGKKSTEEIITNALAIQFHNHTVATDLESLNNAVLDLLLVD